MAPQNIHENVFISHIVTSKKCLYFYLFETIPRISPIGVRIFIFFLNSICLDVIKHSVCISSVTSLSHYVQGLLINKKRKSWHTKMKADQNIPIFTFPSVLQSTTSCSDKLFKPLPALDKIDIMNVFHTLNSNNPMWYMPSFFDCQLYYFWNF